MNITLYSQENCETCTSIKEQLVGNGIYFEDRNVNDTSQDGPLEKGKFLWEHKDLVEELELPPWLPKLIIEHDGDTQYVCVSDRNDIKGNVSIFKTPEDGLQRVKEIINKPTNFSKNFEVTDKVKNNNQHKSQEIVNTIDKQVFQTEGTTIRYDVLDKEEGSFKNIGLKYQADKARNGYLGIYEKYFTPLKNKKINILEIGIHEGASARLWREWFKNAHVIGVDIIPNYKTKDTRGNYQTSNELDSEGAGWEYIEFDKFFKNLGNSSFFCGDAGDPTFLNEMVAQIKEKTGRGPDIIIDDGSHFQYDQMTTLGHLFPHLEPQGIYIIEDMCTATDLNTGSDWWGSEDWSTDKSRWKVESTKQKKDWLPNGEKNTYYCSETTMERFAETQILDSAFLTKEQCNNIMTNTQSVNFYKALKEPITCDSSVGVITKKNK